MINPPSLTTDLKISSAELKKYLTLPSKNCCPECSKELIQEMESCLHCSWNISILKLLNSSYPYQRWLDYHKLPRNQKILY